MSDLQVKKAVDGQYFLPPGVACQIAGVTNKTLLEWAKEDNPPPKEKDGFPAQEFGRWIRHHQIMKRGRGGKMLYLAPGLRVADGMTGSAGIDDNDYNTQRTRTERAKAEKLERENLEAAGELVSAADVERAWFDILTRVKTRMLRVPVTAAPLVAGEEDLAGVQRAITEVIRDGLTELSADWRDAVSDNDDDDDD